MKKRIVLLRKRADVPFDAFDEHWSGPHAAIVSALPGIREYVQNPVVEHWSTRSVGRSVDGIVEVWFDDSGVASAEQHTSEAQQDDEVTFIGSLTAFTVTNRDSYDPESKVWILGEEQFDPAIFAEAVTDLGPIQLIQTEPEDRHRLMERPRLERENAAPAGILVIGAPKQVAHRVYEAAVKTAESAAGTGEIRVLLTSSRRMM
nr:EthD family reductase [Planosporangium thailandense]